MAVEGEHAQSVAIKPWSEVAHMLNNIAPGWHSPLVLSDLVAMRVLLRQQAMLVFTCASELCRGLNS